MINGSQKIGESNTGILLDRLNDLIKEEHEVIIYNCGSKVPPTDTLKEIISADVLVLAFPLFVYTMPSNTLAMLVELEKVIKQEQATHLILYTIINNGFFEGKQNDVAFENVKHWCNRAGVVFGGGIGQGAGEMVQQVKHMPIDKSPFANLSRTLQAMVRQMEAKEPFEIVHLNPYFPRFLYNFLGTWNWNKNTKKNGLSKRDIKRRL